MSRYAISDIHGCAATFKALLKEINFSKSDELFLLGDYIDRGPDSKGVIDHIWDLQSAGYQVHCLRGNHEQMMIEAGLGLRELQFWTTNGGYETLLSFETENIREVPQKYLDWISNLDFYLESPGYILVHAGLDTKAPEPFQNNQFMLWSRYWYREVNKDWLDNRVIIHGHTPTKKGQINYQLNHLDELPALVIDNGCFLQRLDFGSLIAFDLDRKILHAVPCIDR